MKSAISPKRPRTFVFSLGKWGNGLTMRLGCEAQRMLGLQQGDRLRGEISVVGGDLTLTLKLTKAAKPRYTLTQLLAGCASAARPSEPWLNRAPMGREVPAAAPAKHTGEPRLRRR